VRDEQQRAANERKAFALASVPPQLPAAQSPSPITRSDTSPTHRSTVFMVFSRRFFMNTEALVNRGISLAATLHIRRYMEQFFWHPQGREAQFAV